MTLPFEGVTVVEVAAWTFVPGAAAIMADLGATVIKVEPPTGDPQRALLNKLVVEGAPAPFVEIPNRGKRSITLDLSSEAGRGLLLRLVDTADVFLTSYLPSTRQRLRIDVEDLLRVNPRLIYGRGTGWGSKGPMANQGGYDIAAAWASTGTMAKVTAPNAPEPAPQPMAYCDLHSSNSLAGAVAMALFRRERTGEGGVVDVSLMNTGMWAMGPDIVAAPYVGEMPRPNRTAPGNPIVNYYRTADDRWIALMCLQPDPYWPELCKLIGRDDLAADPKYADFRQRFQNRAECTSELDRTFGERTLADWTAVLEDFTGVWAPDLTPAEVHEHLQVEPNSFLVDVTANDGSTFKLVAPPYQFDEQPALPRSCAPEIGQDTETLLLEIGLDWDEIGQAQEAGAFGK